MIVTASMKNRGAVSMFIVIFTALLITVVTVSFTRLMIRELEQASNQDLSQSAYDSSLAGVEDAKRALAMYNSGSFSGGSFTKNDFKECNGISKILRSDGDVSKEIQVGDPSLNQAYTCVKVYLDTKNYIGNVRGDQTRLVSLKGVSEFNKIRVSWFSSEDLTPGSTINLPPIASEDLSHSWPDNRPSVLEAQLMQTGSTFKVEDFDKTSGKLNSATIFLYPSSSGSTELTIGRGVDGVNPVECGSLASREYACSVILDLPAPVGGDASDRTNAFLRLIPRYNASHFQVTLLNDSEVIKFDGVQPKVDSTARADDLFRRVSARVELISQAAYPEASVDINGDFCKTFRITDKANEYSNGSCIP